METESRPATRALARLYRAIADIAGPNLIESGEGLSSEATPLVDIDGQIIGVLSADLADDVGGRTREVLDALIDAYNVVVAAEATALRATETAQRARHDAHTDHLTGLVNRRAWDIALAQEQARYERNESRPAVAIIDLDGFKSVNDEHGHLAGDLLLRQTASLLRDTFRAADVVARTGGDEFAILVVDYADTDPAPLVDRIRRGLALVDIRASVGAAPAEPSTGLQGAVESADRAMYADKQARRASDIG